MQQLITILHILVSICVIALVLIQRGKGSDMGAGFGSGASGTMFGSQGATPFLVKLTASLAMVFFISSSVLSFVVGREAVQTETLPFIAAPVKAVQPIPVSSEVQQDQDTAATSETTSAAPVVTPAPKSALKKESANKTSTQKAPVTKKENSTANKSKNPSHKTNITN